MTRDEQRQVERSVVLHLLDQDHVAQWTIEELDLAMCRVTGGLVVRHVLGELERVGVVVLEGEHARASAVA